MKQLSDIPGGGRVFGLLLAGYVSRASRSPYPIIDPITFKQICNFRDPNSVTFYLCISLVLNEEHFTLHLQCKHSGTFANRKYGELPSPKGSENVRPHCTNSVDNATPTPSSGTSPLASYEEVTSRD